MTLGKEKASLVNRMSKRLLKLLRVRSWLGALNFYILQWVGLRLAYNFSKEGKPENWHFETMLPLAGWVFGDDDEEVGGLIRGKKLNPETGEESPDDFHFRNLLPRLKEPSLAELVPGTATVMWRLAGQDKLYSVNVDNGVDAIEQAEAKIRPLLAEGEDYVITDVLRPVPKG